MIQFCLVFWWFWEEVFGVFWFGFFVGFLFSRELIPAKLGPGKAQYFKLSFALLCP